MGNSAEFYREQSASPRGAGGRSHCGKCRGCCRHGSTIRSGRDDWRRNLPGPQGLRPAAGLHRGCARGLKPAACQRRLRSGRARAGLLPAFNAGAFFNFTSPMPNRLKTFLCAGAGFVIAFSAVNAQTNQAAPAASTVPLAETKTKPATPPLPTGPSTKSDNLLLVQASTSNAGTSPAPSTATTTNTTTATTSPGPVEPDSVTDNGGVGVREFQGDDVGQVLRLLARQTKINMVVSDQIPPNTTVTMRLEDVTAIQAISIIVKAKGLFMDKIDNVYYIKTPAEKTAEPTESDSYQFSYSRAKDIAPLLASQLSSKEAPQFDERTNTIFFRETRSNIDNVRKLLVTIDKPTKQVMIEARLVEVTANPKQSYGINWAGVVGSSSNAKTVSYGAPANASVSSSGSSSTSTNGTIPTSDFVLGSAGNHNIFGNLSQLA